MGWKKMLSAEFFGSAPQQSKRSCFVPKQCNQLFKEQGLLK
jgi:hypothetical protein